MFYVIRTYISVLTESRHLFRPRTRWINSTPTHHISLHTTLLLLFCRLCLGHLSCLFTSDFPATFATCPHWNHLVSDNLGRISLVLCKSVDSNSYCVMEFGLNSFCCVWEFGPDSYCVSDCGLNSFCFGYVGAVELMNTKWTSGFSKTQ